MTEHEFISGGGGADLRRRAMGRMKILINGEEQTVRDGTTVSTLLADLGRNVKFCAVERNSELVPRAEHSQCTLTDGDRVEIVTLVGGG